MEFTDDQILAYLELTNKELALLWSKHMEICDMLDSFDHESMASEIIEFYTKSFPKVMFHLAIARGIQLTHPKTDDLTIVDDVKTCRRIDCLRIIDTLSGWVHNGEHFCSEYCAMINETEE